MLAVAGCVGGFDATAQLLAVLAVGAAVLAGQLSVGWHNDWLDAERDSAAARPDKPVATGAVSRRTVARCALIALAAAVLKTVGGDFVDRLHNRGG